MNYSVCIRTIKTANTLEEIKSAVEALDDFHNRGYTHVTEKQWQELTNVISKAKSMIESEQNQAK